MTPLTFFISYIQSIIKFCWLSCQNMSISIPPIQTSWSQTATRSCFLDCCNIFRTTFFVFTIAFLQCYYLPQIMCFLWSKLSNVQRFPFSLRVKVRDLTMPYKELNGWLLISYFLSLTVPHLLCSSCFSQAVAVCPCLPTFTLAAPFV